jgi:hypothetical protein
MVRIVLIDAKGQLGFPFHAIQCQGIGFKDEACVKGRGSVTDTNATDWSGLSGSGKEICRAGEICGFATVDGTPRDEKRALSQAQARSKALAK